MDREKFLEKLFPLIGGKENTSLCEFQDGVLYVTLKDAGLADENAVAKLPDVASAALRRGRLTVTFGEPERKEEVPFMANKNTDYRALAKEILANVGGKENVEQVFHCVTRLRVVPQNKSNVNQEALKKLDGVMQVMDASGQIQVVIGPQVGEVYSEFCKLAGINQSEVVSPDFVVKNQKRTLKSFLGNLMTSLTQIITPAIDAFIAGGMAKGFSAILTAFHLLASDHPIITLLGILGDAPFYFLPFVLGFTTAKRMKIKEVYGLIIAGILMYPTILNATAGDTLKVLGLSIPCVSYASSVFPVILSVIAFGYIYRLVNRVIPDSVKIVFVGFLALLISMPFVLAWIAPLGNYLTAGIASAINTFFDVCPWLAGAVYCSTKPLQTIFGVKGWGPFIMANLSELGYDYLLAHAFISNICVSGACFGYGITSKETKIRSSAFSTGGMCILGITEPALYGVLIPSRVGLAASIVGGAVAGAVMMLLNVRTYAFSMPGIFSLPTYIDNGNNIIMTLITMAVAFAASFAVAFALNMSKKSKKEAV